MSERTFNRIINLEAEIQQIQIDREKSIHSEEWITQNLKLKYHQRMYEMAKRLYFEEPIPIYFFPVATFNAEVKEN